MPMTPAAALSRLRLSTKLLLAVLPVHLLLFLPRLAGAPAELFNVVWILSALLCIAGFMLADPLLGINAEAADFTRTRMGFDVCRTWNGSLFDCSIPCDYTRIF